MGDLGATASPPSDRPTVPTYDVCGIKIAAVTEQQAAEIIVDAARREAGLVVHLCNAYTLSMIGDVRLRDALESADLNLPDGAPVAWFGRKAGTDGPVRGSDLVGAVARLGVGDGVRHYFYGGAHGVVDELAASIREHAAGVQIVGRETPPFREPTPEELDAVGDRIRACGASVVWIGLGTPRQDYVAKQLGHRVTAVFVPVGAAFDFWSGRVAQAPKLLRGSGLEWLYRLVREPRRLWRRYLLGNPRFLLLALKHSLRGSRS